MQSSTVYPPESLGSAVFAATFLSFFGLAGALHLDFDVLKDVTS